MARSSLVIAVAAALTLAVTACDPAPVQDAATTATSSSAPRTTPFDDPAALADAVRAAVTQAKTFKLLIDVNDPSAPAPGRRLKITGAGRHDGTKTDFVFTKQGPDRTVEFRYIGQTLYVKDRQNADGRSWLKVSPENLVDMYMIQGMDLLWTSVDPGDPGRTIAQIAGAGTITASDRTQLNGAPAEHYAIRMDTDRKPDLFAPSGASASIRSGIPSLHLPYELWLGKDLLPLQLTTDLDPAVKTETPGKTVVTYSDWGKPVDITAPPEDQVYSLGG